jgi:hypothetical protein
MDKKFHGDVKKPENLDFETWLNDHFFIGIFLLALLFTSFLTLSFTDVADFELIRHRFKKKPEKLKSKFNKFIKLNYMKVYYLFLSNFFYF